MSVICYIFKNTSPDRLRTTQRVINGDGGDRLWQYFKF